MYRIAHALPFPTVGGTEHATLRVARAVAGLGFESVAVYPNGAAAVAELFRADNIEVVPYDLSHPSYRHPRQFLQNSSRLAGELRRRRIDLLHCSDLGSAYYAGLAGRLAGVPVLCHIRNRWDQISLRDRSFLRLLVDRFAFVSRSTWKQFAFPVRPNRGRVIYDGFAIPEELVGSEKLCSEVHREFGIHANSSIVTMVARVALQKDHPTLIRAAARVVYAFPGVHFLLIGPLLLDQSYFKELTALIDSLGLGAHFTFTGYRNDTQRLIAAGDLTVLCTHQEGLPLVILEAMACAKPVIATAVDGIPEIVADGETGLLHAHGDAEQLADRILFLLNDPVASARLGLAGRQRCRDYFSFEFAQSMAAYYRDILAAPFLHRVLGWRL